MAAADRGAPPKKPERVITGRQGAGSLPEEAPPKKPVRVITVTSGKGGVGKSSLALALALALDSLGRRVLLWDADLGLANIDVLLGLKTKATIHDLLSGSKTLPEIIARGPGRLKIMPAASGILELGQLSEGQKERLLSEFDDWDEDLDFLLIDTAAGLGSNVVYFNLAAQERILVVTPEPTSITDAYALVKVLSSLYQQNSFHILPNMVANEKEAKNVFSLLSSVSDRHLSVSLRLIGFVPRDPAVPAAVRAQTPFFLGAPEAEASRRVLDIAKTIAANPPADLMAGGGLVFFLNRLAGFGGKVD